MKNVLRVCCCLLLLSAATTACKNRVGGMNGKQQPVYFASAEDAVKKAKEDFLAVLRSDSAVNLGVDAATLERAQPGPTVRRADLDFEKLLSADSTKPFDALVKSQRNIVVPFITNDNVVTIVEVNRAERGWVVIGLAGKDIADDLNIVRKAAGDTASAGITLYEVPNLQTRVYGVKRDNADLLFTNFRDRFSIRQGVRAGELIPALRQAAIEFQRQYGDILKQQKLVR